MPQLPLPKDCCGCASCVDICPKDALSLQEDKSCYYNIKIDSSKCIECKLCEKQCHIIHPEKLKRSSPKSVQPLAAWSMREDLIRHSASGGIFAQIAFNMLQEGNAYVYGATLEADNTVKHIEVSEIKDLILLQNSKYQQSNCTGIYRQAKKRLKEGAKVLFSGVPCQIAAIYSFLDYNEHLIKNLFTIEILCHGVPCNDIHRTSLKINKASKIFAYRNKEDCGWCSKKGNNNHLSYLDKEGKRFIISSYKKDTLFRSYLSSNYTREGCFHCPYSDIHRIADLSLGDFWGWNKTSNPQKYENYWGTSIVLRNSEKGQQMMNGNGFVCKNTTWHEFLPINQNLYMPTNAYDYKGCKIMPFVQFLPASVKNVIYQNGFSNLYLDRLFNLVKSIFFRNKHKAAAKVKKEKAAEILKYLETK